MAPDTLWFNESGELIFDDGGGLVFCDECPCDDSVPDDIWTWSDDETDFPILELLYTYALSMLYQVHNHNSVGDCSGAIDNGSQEFRFIEPPGPVTVTAIAGASPAWQITGITIERRIRSGGAWGAWTSLSDLATVTLSWVGGTPNVWRIHIRNTPFGSFDQTFEKDTGDTPVGTYTNTGNDGCVSFGGFSVNYISTVTVS